MSADWVHCIVICCPFSSSRVFQVNSHHIVLLIPFHEYSSVFGFPELPIYIRIYLRFLICCFRRVQFVLFDFRDCYQPARRKPPVSHCGCSAADAYCPHTYLYTGRWDFPSKSLSLTSLSPRLLAIFCASSSDVIDTLAPSTPCSVILSLLTPATPLAAADSTLLVFLGRCAPEWSAKKRLVITFGPRTLRHSWPVLRIPFIAAAMLLRRNQVGSRNSHFVQYSMCVGSSSNPSKPKTC